MCIVLNISVGFSGIRRVASCSGTFECMNVNYPYLASFKKRNKVNFKRKEKNSAYCGSCGYEAQPIHCYAKKVWEFGASRVTVFYCGEHTWTAIKPKPDISDKASQFFKTNSSAKPCQFPYETLRCSFKDGKSVEEIYDEAKDLTDLRKIQNVKQKVLQEMNPIGHSFDALGKIKEATDKYDPYLLWKVHDGRLAINKMTALFRTSREKLEVAVQMQRGLPLSEEVFFLDAEHDRVKGMKTINLSVQHPTLNEMVCIASMECITESSETLSAFWDFLNQVC